MFIVDLNETIERDSALKHRYQIRYSVLNVRESVSSDFTDSIRLIFRKCNLDEIPL